MFVVDNYALAVILCVITMICWGSWANAQKIVAGHWRQELFYWDYVVGVWLVSIILGFTLGSIGEQGRGFVEDLGQISLENYCNAFIGGAIMNTANLLLTISISLVGMAVAFPVGVGIGLVFGVLINYFAQTKGDPVILFLGVGLVVTAIILSGLSAGMVGKKKSTDSEEESKKKAANSRIGLILALVAGVFISFFYRFVAASMDLNDFVSPAAQKATPYSAFFIFASGMFACNLVLNSFFMKKPFVGPPVTYRQYFGGSFFTHAVGISGGLVWGLGSGLSYLAMGKAGAAVAYALSQGATMVAALWGLLIWREFRGASKTVNVLLTLMVLCFIVGLVLIITSGAN